MHSGSVIRRVLLDRSTSRTCLPGSTQTRDGSFVPVSSGPKVTWADRSLPAPTLWKLSVLVAPWHVTVAWNEGEGSDPSLPITIAMSRLVLPSGLWTAVTWADVGVRSITMGFGVGDGEGDGASVAGGSDAGG